MGLVVKIIAALYFLFGTAFLLTAKFAEDVEVKKKNKLYSVISFLAATFLVAALILL